MTYPALIRYLLLPVGYMQACGLASTFDFSDQNMPCHSGETWLPDMSLLAWETKT